jgi:hypothetical protein
LSEALGASLKAAMHAGSLNESVILDRLQKESANRLNRMKIDSQWLTGTNGAAVWRYDATGVLFQFLPDGTLVEMNNKSRHGMWTFEGRLLVITWNDGEEIERYLLKPNVASWHCRSNKSEFVVMSIVEPATRLATTGPATLPVAGATTQPSTPDSGTGDAEEPSGVAASQPASTPAAQGMGNWFDDPTSQPATRP